MRGVSWILPEVPGSHWSTCEAIACGTVKGLALLLWSPVHHHCVDPSKAQRENHKAILTTSPSEPSSTEGSSPPNDVI